MEQSYTSLEPDVLSSLGVSLPSLSGGEGSFLATSTFVYVLFFTAITIAAVYRYLTAGAYRMQASEQSIRLSNQIFKQVSLGLLGVFSLFLLLFTINKDLVTGDVGLEGVKLRRGASGTTAVDVPSSPGPAAGAPTGNGTIPSRIYSSALSIKGMSTKDAAGTNNGRLACAYAVNEVLKKAGISPIDHLSVASMEAGLTSGRGTLITQQSAIPGDIVIEAGKGHVGICLNTGCTDVLSNSSSNASFTWVSRPDFLPSYRNGTGRFYRVNH